MKRSHWLFCILVWLTVRIASAEVRVFVEDASGVAWIRYECTAGEVVRAFALDVTVDHGRIVGISDFFKGVSRVGATGYGIFPASFRDHITVTSATDVDWEMPDYTPVASAADDPLDTLPGLNSSGITLEFGALWDPAVPDGMPASYGTLCALHLSGPAKVLVTANLSRGGIVSAFPAPIIPTFAGASVGPAITNVRFDEGVMTVSFQDGELQTADSLDGQWIDTGNTTGEYSEATGDRKTMFFRVRGTADL